MFLQQSMKQKTIILYDLKNKTQIEKVQIGRKLYGYRDKSNYSYKYDRKGNLEKVSLTKEKKVVIKLDDNKDLTKVVEILKKASVDFEIAKLQ